MPVAMLALVAFWALAEALLFFIVADVPIMAMGLRHGWRGGVLAAVIASLFAALGGVVMLLWSAQDPAGTRAMIESLPAISGALIDQTAAQYRSGGWWAMLQGSFAGTPYKLYAHAAGMDGTFPVHFALISIAARLPRFLLVGALAGLAGPWLKARLRPRRMWLIFAAAWSVFYLLYFSAMAA